MAHWVSRTLSMGALDGKCCATFTSTNMPTRQSKAVFWLSAHPPDAAKGNSLILEFITFFGGLFIPKNSKIFI